VISGFLRAARAREVWLHMGIQDVKNRYKRSLVGPLWIAISMGVLVLGLGFLFGRLFNQEPGRYVVYLTISMMIWSLILSSVTDGGYTFIGAESYIKQIPFPKQVYIFRTTVVNLVVFSFGFPIYIGATVYYRFDFGWGCLWAIPGLALVLVCCMAHTTAMAYLSVMFRDLPPASASLMQLVYFVTPIIYPVQLLRDRGLDAVFRYNPFYYLIEVVRHPLLERGPAEPFVYAVTVAYALLAWTVALGVAAVLDRRIAYSL